MPSVVRFGRAAPCRGVALRPDGGGRLEVEPSGAARPEVAR